MKELRQEITPRQVVTTLLVAIVAMLLIPVGAEAAKEKPVHIVDPVTGAVAGVSPQGALEIGNAGDTPIAIDGSVTVDPSSEPLTVNGTVELDQDSGPVGSFPDLPPNHLQFDVDEPLFSYDAPVPYVALTSITASSTSSDQAARVILTGVYTGKGCTDSGSPRIEFFVQPHTTTHIDLPVPLIFARDTISCDHGEVPVTRNGFALLRSEGDANVLLIGSHG